MSLSEITSLRPHIDSLADETCWLFLWAPTTMTEAAFHVIRSWGFRRLQQRIFTWVKTTTKNGKLHWGMGTVTRSNPEDVWCGVRGKPQRVSASVHSVILAPRREHSRKPDEIYQRIEMLCGDVPRVELFARQRWPGWDQALSNQAKLYQAEVG